MAFQTSPFLSLLPLEIRLQIYSEVLSSHTIPLHLTNNGQALTTPREILAEKLLSLPLTCHQMYYTPPILNPTNTTSSTETLPLLYTHNTFALRTTTALRFLSRLPSHPLIRTLHFTFPLPHLPYFKNLPHTLSPHSSSTLQTDENPKDPLQPQDITWLETWSILTQMHGLKTLRVELDVPFFWRRNWCEKEGEMLGWIASSSLSVPEFIIGVLWDESESEDELGRRERFGSQERAGENGGMGERRREWRVERLHRKDENDLWQRDWGYLVDLSMSA